MIIELIKRSLFGIAIGSLITFIVLTFFVVLSVDSTVLEIWKSLLTNMLIGMYFSSASMIFESEKWSLLKQTMFHFFLTLFFIFPLLIFAGWITFNFHSLLVSVSLFTLIYFIGWLGVYLYYKRLERSMNDSIAQKYK